MRLMCTVLVVNRAFLDRSVNHKKKVLKSTLALCKQPKSEEYCMLWFSSQNTNGTKYNLKANISQVFTKFVHEGKATVKFIQPQHDVSIQADTIQLKGFLHLLKRILDNKVSPKDFTMSSLAVTPIKTVAPKKLTILKRSDYPLHGFPRTLEELHINDIRRCGLDRGILQLSKLRVLDLSHNLIEYLPEEFNRLPNLKQLNLSHNQFGISAPRKWDWMGNQLSKTLQTLNLTNNQMVFLPDQLIRLYNLVILHIDGNQLKMLPSGIGNLRQLKVLTAAENEISFLPGSVRKWNLLELDLSNNRFNEQQNRPSVIQPQPLPACSLKEYAARKVLYARVSYSSETLPATLIKYLELGRYCVCSKACFEHYIKDKQMFYLNSAARNIKLSSHELSYVPMECYSCSIKCYNSTAHRRDRQLIM